MLKITHYEQTETKVIIEITFSFLQGKQSSVRKEFTKREEAMRFFAYYASEFLKAQVDELHSVIEQIRPHYFELHSGFVTRTDHAWREFYWKFKHEVKPALSAAFNNTILYKRLVLFHQEHIRGLVPEHDELGRTIVQGIVDDIELLVKHINQVVDEFTEQKKSNSKNVA